MTKSIFVIEDPSEIGAIIEKINHDKDSKVFSLNYFTHKILAKNNIVHEIGENYLDTDDKNKIDDDSINATINWSNDEKIRQYVNFDGINLPILIELELSQYLMPIYRSATAILRIIEKEKPTLIVSATYLNDFVERICIDKNIQVVLIKKTEQPSLQYDRINIKFNLGKTPFSITISRSMYMKIKKISDTLTDYIFNLKPNFDDGKKSILLLEFNPVQYVGLIKELSKLDKNIILLNQRRPAIWNTASFKIVKNSRCKILNLKDLEQNSVINSDDEFIKFNKSLDNLWTQDIVFEKIFQLNSYTLWYSIKKSFTKICDSRFKESVRRIKLVKNMFHKLNISVILEWAELGQEEKEILYISKKHGVKSIMLQHAMFPTSKFWDKYSRFVLFFSHPPLSDKQAIWGDIVMKHAFSYGFCKDLTIVGSPKHDDFFNNYDIKQNTGIILFATTQVSGIHAENSTTDKYLKFDDFVKEVCRVSKLFPDKKLIVKPHPAPDFINNITELLKEIDPTITITHSTNVKDLIANCDLLITFNNSTIALDSLTLGKPTMVLQLEKWAEESDIVKADAVLSINKIDDIENGIRSILYDEKFQGNLILNGKNFVKSYLSNRGTASKSLADLLNNY